MDAALAPHVVGIVGGTVAHGISDRPEVGIQIGVDIRERLLGPCPGLVYLLLVLIAGRLVEIQEVARGKTHRREGYCCYFAYLFHIYFSL